MLRTHDEGIDSQTLGVLKSHAAHLARAADELSFGNFFIMMIILNKKLGKGTLPSTEFNVVAVM